MSPTLIVLRIGAIIFAVEGLIMLVLSALPHVFQAMAARSEWGLAAMDAAVLVLISSPAIYLWVIRPYVLARAHDETVLQESESRLNEAQRIANIGSWELDLRANTLSWSDEIYRIFEIDPTNFGASYEAFLDAIHPEDREMVNKAYASSLANHSSYEISHRLRMLDGRIKWVHERCETDFGVDGNPLISRGTVQDITERKHTEKELQTSEKRLAGIIDIAPEAIISIDQSQRIVLFNQSAEAIFGYSANEVLGQYLKMLLPARNREIHDKHIENFAHSSISRRLWSKRMALSGLRRDGSEFPAEASILKLQQDEETIFTVMLHDISERKRAEEEAKKAQGRLEEALEAMDEGFVIFDAQDRLDQCNSKFRELFSGLSDLLERKPTFNEWARVCIERHVIKPTSGDSDEWLANRIRQHRECDGPYEYELGDGRWISLSEYKTKSGCTAGLRVDITKRKQAEQKLLKLNEHLQQQSRELRETAKNLIQARNQAELANRAKSEFLANMSHELRTPLNAIIGFSEVMQGETFGPIGSPKYLEYATDISQSGEHLLALINDILDLSKIEVGKVNLYVEAVDVCKVVESCQILVKERAGTTHVTVKSEIADDLPHLNVDERKFKQILVNLLSNAIKFTPSGGKVTIRARSSFDDGYEFQIADTGIGIAHEDIAKALAPFSQIDSNLSRKYEGTGLGLSLAKALAELHGGSLDLQSKVGVGTTVTVRFPAERIVSEAATGTLSPSASNPQVKKVKSQT